MAYEGPERRVHRIFVTRNTEYHLRKQHCIGVRDRETGEWLHGHFALDRTVCGSIRFFESGAMSASPGLPRLGESMYFEDEGRDLVTSAIVSVERPRPEIVEKYSDA